VRAAILVLVAIGPWRVARAQSEWPARAAVTVDARGEIGTGRVAGIDLGAIGAGIEWRAAPTLRLRTVALLLGGTGSTDSGRSTNGGAGGELAARLVPFPAWPLRPYARMSAGFLLFLRGPFLPSGDFYDFIVELGGGLELPLGTRFSLMGDLHVSHLSNGQGLGPFNPAFDGYGGTLAINYALASEVAPETVPCTEPEGSTASPDPRLGWIPGVMAEAGAGATTQFVFGGRVRVAERLAPRTLAMLDAESQSIGGVPYQDVGLGLVGHWSRVTAGVQGTYEHLPGIDAVAEQVQGEAQITREASLVATGIWQQQSVFADVLTAGLGLRMFPIATLRIDVGVRLARILAAGEDTRRSPYWGFEWQLPLGARAWQLSIFVERQLSTIGLAGLRIAWNMGGTLRDVARRTGWVRLR
jgi:hypothetical protein